MRYRALYRCVIVFLLFTSACSPGWKHQGGVQTLPEVYFHRSPASVTLTGAEVKVPEAGKTAASRRVSFTLPAGWHGVMRGDDFIATKDGVFLQNITIERIHVDQVEQSDGMFPLAAFSSKQWPFRTVKNLKKRFAQGMSPAEAADVVLASRANNPRVIDLEVREVVLLEFAGNKGFKAVYDFKLNVQGRNAPYRAVYCGFMLNEWFYGVNYSAARRYYFQRDAETFESLLQSIRLVEK